MTIKCDNAIKSKEEDLLGRKRFAVNIAENIIKYENNKAITIGLIGKWGSGKSSVINMMKEHIKQEEKDIGFIDFNPWYFSGGSKLIEEFFEVLISYLGIENDGLNELGKKLKLYSLILKPFSFIPQVGRLADDLYGVTKEVSEAISEFYKQEKSDINSLKESINEELKSLNKKIVITIDDIDRLENEEVKEIFKLVRGIGDFNNIIYILAFDDRKVCKVFSSGPDYIEKIINIPIYIPEVSQRIIDNYVSENLYEIFPQNQQGIEYRKRIFGVLLKGKFKNLREVNRMLNVLIFNKEWMLKEVNFIDYMIITFLKLYDKEVYTFIKNNKDLLLKDDFENDIKKHLDDSQIHSKRGINIVNLIRNMFKKSFNKNLRAINKKIYFDAYFEELLIEQVYTSDELGKYVSIKSKEELYIYLSSISLDELLKIFRNIEEIAFKLNKKQRYFWEELLREKIELLDKDKKINFQGDTEQKMAFESLKVLLRGLDDYKKILKTMNLKEKEKNYDNLIFMNYILSIKNILNVKFDNETLNEIKEYIYSIKYNENMYNIFKVLRYIGIDVEEYIKHIISEDEGLIIYLKSTEEVVNVNSYCSYDEEGEPDDYGVDEDRGIILENITDFINYDYVKERVDSLSESFKNNNRDIIREFECYFGRADVYAHLYGEEIEL